MRTTAMVVALAALATSACAEGDAATPLEADALAVPVFAASQGPGQTDHFRTHLTGDEEVPANASRAQGQATFKLSADGTELHFKLNVANIENVFMAHIHRAPAGTNGGIVVWLYPRAAPGVLLPGRTQGTLAEGVITDADVIGSLAGQGVAGLLARIRAGNTYVNVHTSQFGGGEIRGQID